MKLEIKIPTDLSEVTLEQYQKFIKAIDQNDDEFFIMQKMLQYFCDIDLMVSSKLKHKDIIDIVTKLNDMLQATPKHVERFTLNGVDFGFEPSLDDIAITAYADIDGYVQSWDTMHKALAVLYRPVSKKQIGGRYLIEPYNGTEKYGEFMKQAPASIAISTRVFFYTLGNDLLKATLLSIQKDKQVMSSLKKHNLLNSGDGMLPFIQLLGETLLDLTNLQKFQFTKLLHS
jgi:hypothetical protein